MAKFPMILVNKTLPLVLKMSPNPNSISIDREKVYSQTQTLGGWVFEHWGEKPRVLRVKGRTLPKLGKGSGGKHSEIGVEAALFALQQVYNLDKRMLVNYMGLLKNPTSITKITSGDLSVEKLRELSETFIYYKYDMYRGFFTKFNFEQVAEQHPRHYEYEFEFLITSSAQSALLNGMLTSSFAPAGTLAGLASIGVSGDPLAAITTLAGAEFLSKVEGIGGLNI